MYSEDLWEYLDLKAELIQKWDNLWEKLRVTTDVLWTYSKGIMNVLLSSSEDFL